MTSADAEAGTASARDVDEPSPNRLRSLPAVTPWRFPVGETITIVSSAVPRDALPNVPWSSKLDPDFVGSYRYADLDSVIELFGHLRAVNPDNPVQIKISDELYDDDRSTHLVLLGGVDGNGMTRDVSGRVGVPVRQAGRVRPDDCGAFEVEGAAVFEPRFDGDVLVEDVGHFLRAPNPFDRQRTLTICNAFCALGVYGVVRALTDQRFRDRNAGFLADRFAGHDTASILCRVGVLAGGVTVPDWTQEDVRLHLWPAARR
jgi:hypothetical protein